MSLSVNGIAIDLRSLAREIDRHRDTADPESAACRSLLSRELLRQRAVQLRLIGNDAALEPSVTDALLARDMPVPEPTDAECLAYYHRHPAQFREGDGVEASHILFSVTPQRPLIAAQQQAEQLLLWLHDQPMQFEAAARRHSACPSASSGGYLGVLLRGQCAPEFELVLFDGNRTGLLSRLINTRYGFHIVRIERRIDGELQAFEAVRPAIARRLAQQARARIMRLYIARLAGAADISGSLGGMVPSQPFQ